MDKVQKHNSFNIIPSCRMFLSFVIAKPTFCQMPAKDCRWRSNTGCRTSNSTQHWLFWVVQKDASDVSEESNASIFSLEERQ